MLNVRNDHVELTLRGTKAIVPVEMWLRDMQAAIALRANIMARENKQPQDKAEWFAYDLLCECLPQFAGSTTQEKIDGFLARIHTLKNPTQSKVLFCAKCTRPISSKVSIALGVGPECRGHKQ